MRLRAPEPPAAIIGTDSVAIRFVEALNGCDLERLIALTESSIEFAPVSVTAPRRVYIGHQGLRAWSTEPHLFSRRLHTSVREGRESSHGRIVLLTDSVIGGEPVPPSAMVMRLGMWGNLAQVHWYFLDEELLEQLGVMRRAGLRLIHGESPRNSTAAAETIAEPVTASDDRCRAAHGAHL